MEKRRVTEEHVKEAVEDLKERGLLSDTSKNPDGTRSAESWSNAIHEDFAIIKMQMEMAMREGTSREEIAKCLGVMRKEAIRLESDIRRFGNEVFGIGKEEIDAQGPY